MFWVQILPEAEQKNCLQDVVACFALSDLSMYIHVHVPLKDFVGTINSITVVSTINTMSTAMSVW